MCTHLYLLVVWNGGLNKGMMTPACILVPVRAASPAVAMKPYHSVLLGMSLALFELSPLLWSLRQVLVSDSVLGLFKRMPGSTAALHLTWSESPLIFTASYCGNSSSQHWCSKLGSPAWAWDLCSRDIPPDSNHGTWVWGRPIQHRCPSYRS